MFDLKQGRTYSDFGLYYILMKKEVPENDPKYSEGYRLIGSNGAYYRLDGTGEGVIELKEDVTDAVSQTVRGGGHVFETQEEAFNLELSKSPPDNPYGSIQWKGTGVCIDMHCRCGYHSHVDASFMYFFECPACHRTYVCSSRIDLIEYKGASDPNKCQPVLGDEGLVEEDNFS